MLQFRFEKNWINLEAIFFNFSLWFFEQTMMDQLVHPQDGQIWRIAGLERDGGLRLRQGSRTETWRRWP